MNGAEDMYVRILNRSVSEILKSFDEDSGRFVTAGWGITNQDAIWALAVMYKIYHPNNRYYRNQRVLRAALLGGDCIRNFQYDDGTVEFLKVDGSKWGPTYMPWTMYHWLETYHLLGEELGDERRKRWSEGLDLAYRGIFKEIKDDFRVHNISTWKSMSIYRAGDIWKRNDWKELASDRIYESVRAQHPEGYWTEHSGPTTSYNRIYIHAIGLYHEFSGDRGVIDCLRRGLDFHLTFTYPNGTAIETVDERVRYHENIRSAEMFAYTHFPQGRRYAGFLLENTVKSGHFVGPARRGLIFPSLLASSFLYHHDGPEDEIPQDAERYSRYLGGKEALVRKEGGWVYCLSALVADPVENRWIQERGAHLSVWHENTGLIVGGGNTRNQPDLCAFSFRSGERIEYLAKRACLRKNDGPDRVDLDYGAMSCQIALSVQDDRTLLIENALKELRDARGEVEAHLQLHMHPGGELRVAGEKARVLDGGKMYLAFEGGNGWIEHNGWRLELPRGARFRWPFNPFNPYAKDGKSPPEDCVGVLYLPIDGPGEAVCTIRIPERS